MQDPSIELELPTATTMDLQYTSSWLESNLSGSGSSSVSGSGSGSGEAGPPGALFNCRTSDLNHSSVTSQFYWSVLPNLHYASPYVATVEAIFFVIAFFWNLFILGCFLRRPKLLKEPAHIYLFNLAVTDVLHSVFIILITSISEGTKEFIFGSNDFVRCHFCEFLGFMLLFLVTSSLHTLAILSVDRFVLLARPLRYKQYFNWKRAILIVAVIWFISFWVAIPPVLGFGQYEFNLALANCHARWTGTTNGIPHINYIIYAGVEAVIPFLMLVIFNIWTYKIVTGFLKKRLARQRSFRDTSNMDTTEMQKDRQERTQHTRKQRQLMKVFGGLLLAHVCSWCPTLIMSVVGAIVDPRRIPLEVYLFVWITYISNPVIHPIIETFFVKDLRYRLKKAKTNVRSSIKRASSVGQSIMSRSPSQKSLGRLPSFKSSQPATPTSERTFFKRISKLSMPDTPVTPDSGLPDSPAFQMPTVTVGTIKECNEQETHKVEQPPKTSEECSSKEPRVGNIPSPFAKELSLDEEDTDSPKVIHLSFSPHVTFSDSPKPSTSIATNASEHEHSKPKRTLPSCLKKESSFTEGKEQIEALQTILVTPV